MLRSAYHEDIHIFKVSRTFSGRPLYFAHFFFVDGLLIDTGPSSVAREVAAAAAELPLKQAVITHCHEDHWGNCGIIRNKHRLPVYAHPETLHTMANPEPIQLYRRFLWGLAPATTGGLPAPPVIHTPRHSFQVIPTPGHTPDHISLFEPERRWLFCGDLYLGERLTGFMEGEDIAAHLDSLRRVIALEPQVLFCGLKGRLDDARRRLSAKYAFWYGLGQKIAALHEEGVPAGRMMKILFGGETPFYPVSQKNWGRWHLVRSFIENRHLFVNK